jgi:D-galactarolactone cycloisomerase
VFVNPSEPRNGRFELPTAPGLGMVFDTAEMESRRIAIQF